MAKSGGETLNPTIRNPAQIGNRMSHLLVDRRCQGAKAQDIGEGMTQPQDEEVRGNHTRPLPHWPLRCDIARDHAQEGADGKIALVTLMGARWSAGQAGDTGNASWDFGRRGNPRMTEVDEELERDDQRDDEDGSGKHHWSWVTSLVSIRAVSGTVVKVCASTTMKSTQMVGGM